MSAHPPALPHGLVSPVCEGVHHVRGSFRMGPGLTIGRTMAVIRCEDGLAVVNSIRLSEAGEAALAALGPVKHLIKLADSHGLDDPYYLERYRPTLWSLPGAKLGGLRPDRTLGPDGPVASGTVIDFGQKAGWREAAWLLPHGGGTLVTCDAVQNHAGEEFASLLGRALTPLLGFKGGVIVPPMWRKVQKVAGSRVAEILQGLTTAAYTNLVTGHGPPVIGGADELVRSAIRKASA